MRQSPDDGITSIIRGVARLLSVVFVALAVVFLIGEGGFNPVEQSAPESVLIIFFLAALAGLLLAWRWEGIGGMLAVGSLLAFYLIQFGVSGTFPRGWALPLLAIPGVLFLICRNRSGRGHRR